MKRVTLNEAQARVAFHAVARYAEHCQREREECLALAVTWPTGHPNRDSMLECAASWSERVDETLPTAQRLCRRYELPAVQP
jgi:hypothetical protein